MYVRTRDGLYSWRKLEREIYNFKGEEWGVGPPGAFPKVWLFVRTSTTLPSSTNGKTRSRGTGFPAQISRSSKTNCNWITNFIVKLLESGKDVGGVVGTLLPLSPGTQTPKHTNNNSKTSFTRHEPTTGTTSRAEDRSPSLDRTYGPGPGLPGDDCPELLRLTVDVWHKERRGEESEISI